MFGGDKYSLLQFADIQDEGYRGKPAYQPPFIAARPMQNPMDQNMNELMREFQLQPTAPRKQQQVKPIIPDRRPQTRELPRPTIPKEPVRAAQSCATLGAGSFGAILACDDMDAFARSIGKPRNELSLFGLPINFDKTANRYSASGPLTRLDRLPSGCVIKTPVPDKKGLIDMVSFNETMMLEIRNNHIIAEKCMQYIQGRGHQGDKVISLLLANTAFKLEGTTILSHIKATGGYYPVYKRAYGDVRSLMREQKMTYHMLVRMAYSVVLMLNILQTTKTGQQTTLDEKLHHLDIKPDNILVYKNEGGPEPFRFVLADFGGISNSKPGKFAGFTYASPFAETYFDLPLRYKTKDQVLRNAEYRQQFQSQFRNLNWKNPGAWVKNDLYGLGISMIDCLDTIKAYIPQPNADAQKIRRCAMDMMEACIERRPTAICLLDKATDRLKKLSQEI